MREIKFRQVVASGNEFHKWHYWGFIGDIFIGPHNIADKSYQFTGLCDKNGREIYDGDVVKYITHKTFCQNKKCRENSDELLYGSYCPNCGKKAEEEDFTTRAQVVFSHGSFAYRNETEEYMQQWPTLASEHYIKSVEIIGNIHENPELLEAGK